jgi:hypothetical protein
MQFVNFKWIRIRDILSHVILPFRNQAPHHLPAQVILGLEHVNEVVISLQCELYLKY